MCFQLGTLTLLSPFYGLFFYELIIRMKLICWCENQQEKWCSVSQSIPSLPGLNQKWNVKTIWTLSTSGGIHFSLPPSHCLQCMWVSRHLLEIFRVFWIFCYKWRLFPLSKHDWETQPSLIAQILDQNQMCVEWPFTHTRYMTGRKKKCKGNIFSCSTCIMLCYTLSHGVKSLLFILLKN